MFQKLSKENWRPQRRTICKKWLNKKGFAYALYLCFCSFIKVPLSVNNFLSAFQYIDRDTLKLRRYLKTYHVLLQAPTVVVTKGQTGVQQNDLWNTVDMIMRKTQNLTCYLFFLISALALTASDPEDPYRPAQHSYSYTETESKGFQHLLDFVIKQNR